METSSTARSRGKHRAAHRPTLSRIAEAATGQAGTIAGRGAIVTAAGSGILLSLVAAPTAQAAPVAESVSTALSSKPLQGALNTADLNALSTQARAAISSAPMVTVSTDAELPVERSAVSVVSAQENAAFQAEQAAKAAEEAAAERRASVVSIAMRYLGIPYVWGGTTPAGFDCSGFTSYVYAQVGIDLPRTSAGQRYAGPAVAWTDAQPGDLIWTPGHIAIYAGDGMQIEAPVPGKNIRYTSIWQSNPTFIRAT